MEFNKNYIARHVDLIDLEKLGTRINIIGCGSVGSAVAVQLAKMGFGNIDLWDFDYVEDVNIGCQRHLIRHIGDNKAEATGEMVNESSGMHCCIMSVPYTGQPLNGIIISAVDVMEVRRKIFEGTTPGSLIIDPRMAATQFDLITCVKGKDDEFYEKTLFSDDEAVHTPCTMKSTMFCADILAGMVSFQVFRHNTGKKIDKRLIWDGETNSLTNLYA